jgi:lysyl-tRNA synthetase class 2
MKVTLSDHFLEKFPEAAIYGAVFENVNLLTPESAAWKERAARSVLKSGIKPELLAEHPKIKVWRDAYLRFGLKPGKFRSSIEQLYKRALKGDILETRLPLVNLYCWVSLINMIPAGGYDLSKIEGDITIRLSVEGDEFQAIGERESLRCKPDVVSYADAAGVICYGWNYRDAARTCLQEKTERAVFFVDSVNDSTRQSAEYAMADLSAALRNAGCKIISDFALDKTRPVISSRNA